MTQIIIEIISTLFFAIILTVIIIPRMKKENKHFTWNNYFKKCGIYQGRTHWHDLYDFIKHRKNT
jgi:hypothetical protein